MLRRWKEIFRENETFRNVVLVGCGVQFAQIITGINALVSFSGTMFRQLGVSGLNAAISPFFAFLAGNMIGSFIFVVSTTVQRSVTVGCTFTPAPLWCRTRQGGGPS